MAMKEMLYMAKAMLENPKLVNEKKIEQNLEVIYKDYLSNTEGTYLLIKK